MKTQFKTTLLSQIKDIEGMLINLSSTLSAIIAISYISAYIVLCYNIADSIYISMKPAQICINSNVH